MEHMRIRVRSVERADDGLAVARVVAVSARRVGGRAVARVELVVTFRAKGMAKKDLATRARAVAVEFLDVA
jgi:hypothetical protein